jgi:hypothetical protein
MRSLSKLAVGAAAQVARHFASTRTTELAGEYLSAFSTH